MKNYFRKLIDKHSKFTLIEDKQVRMFMRPPFMRFDSVAYDNYMHNKNNSKYFNDNLVIGCKYRINFIKDKIGVYLGFHAPFHRFKTDDGLTSNINGKDLHKFVRSLNGHEHKKPIALVIKMEDELRCSAEQFLRYTDKISQQRLNGRFEIISKSDIKISNESPDFEDLYMDNLISEYINLKQKQDMKQTELEAGKEYWLGDAKKYKGIYKGNFGKAHYFEVLVGHDFTQDANGYVEFPLRGVFEIEQWKFTTPIAMKCTEEQFNGIKDKLVEMGCKYRDLEFGRHAYIVSNIAGENGVLSTLGSSVVKWKDRTVFESFNPDLFLALAAMTDKEDGIKGEVYTNNNGKFYIKSDEKEGKWHNEFWRKATAQEIIEHFEKKEFVLPENFKVRRNRKNYSEINGYAKTISNENFNNGEGFVYFYNGSASTIKSNCTEITFDQFKKYVLKDSEQSFQNAPVIGSVEYTVNVEFDAEKAAKEIFTKIVELGKSHQPEFKFAWEPCKEKIEKFENFLESFDPFINIKNIDKTVIPIPTTKQATLFDDRVEITDWKPKEGEIIWVVTNEIGSLIYKDVKYNGSLLHAFLFRNGFIKRTESEAKQLVEKLKQAML